MKIVFSTGFDQLGQSIPAPRWPADWTVPRKGEGIDSHGRSLTVAHVVWYPQGDIEDSTEPFVYIIMKG